MSTLFEAISSFLRSESSRTIQTISNPHFFAQRIRAEPSIPVAPDITIFCIPFLITPSIQIP